MGSTPVHHFLGLPAFAFRFQARSQTCGAAWSVGPSMLLPVSTQASLATIVDNRHACMAYSAVGLHILHFFSTREAGARAGQAADRVGYDLQFCCLQSHTMLKPSGGTHEAAGPAAAG